MWSPDVNGNLQIFNDFFVTNGEDNFLATTSGGTISSITATRNNPGINQLASVSAATDRALIRMNANVIRLGGGFWRFDQIISVDTLSNATDEYVLFFGLFDGTSADAVDGVYFEYDRATAGDFWRTATANNSTRTKNTLSNAVTAATFQRFTIDIDAAAGRCRFYIDGVLVQTHTANIPTGASRVTGWGFGYRKTVGTAAVAIASIDALLVQHVMSTPRFTV